MLKCQASGSKSALVLMRRGLRRLSTGVLSKQVEDYARRSCRAFPLEELYRLGRGAERVELAQLVQQEIAIRNAQLCKELLLLPFGLAETRGVRKVVDCFSSALASSILVYLASQGYVKWLAESPVPQKKEDGRSRHWMYEVDKEIRKSMKIMAMQQQVHSPTLLESEIM